MNFLRINNADLFSQPPLLIFIKGANISGGHCVYIYIYTYKIKNNFNVWCEREAEGNLTRNTSLTPAHSVPSQQKVDTSRLAFEDMECHIYCNFNVWATITQLYKEAWGKNAAAPLPALMTRCLRANEWALQLANSNTSQEAQGCNLRTQNNFSTRDFQMNYWSGQLPGNKLLTTVKWILWHLWVKYCSRRSFWGR